MKTSKRLLSILLMLTMLLSMFTVMASADDPEDLCMHVDEEFNTTFTIFHAAATATCFQEGHVAYYECKMCPAEAIYDESSGKFVVQTNGVTKAKDPTNHGGKLPKMDTLKEDGRKLSEQKKKLYAEYRKAKADMQEVTTIKANIDYLLGYAEPGRKKEQER